MMRMRDTGANMNFEYSLKRIELSLCLGFGFWGPYIQLEEFLKLI